MAEPLAAAGGGVPAESGTLGRLPVVGDTVAVDGRTITVVALDGRRVSRLRVAPSADDPDAGGPREPAVKASAG